MTLAGVPAIVAGLRVAIAVVVCRKEAAGGRGQSRSRESFTAPTRSSQVMSLMDRELAGRLPRLPLTAPRPKPTPLHPSALAPYFPRHRLLTLPVRPSGGGGIFEWRPRPVCSLSGRQLPPAVHLARAAAGSSDPPGPGDRRPFFGGNPRRRLKNRAADDGEIISEVWDGPDRRRREMLYGVVAWEFVVGMSTASASNFLVTNSELDSAT